MSLTNLAKSAHGRLVGATAGQRVVFHHVPKCGGTSVGRALRRRYLLSQATVTPESSYRALETFTGRSDRQQMLIDVLDLREQMFLYLLFEDVRCISLHVRFSEVAFKHFRERYKFVTILREPVARFVSHYLWSYGKPHAHAYIEEGFAEYLETPRARRMGASYVEYFCGLSKDVDIRSPEAVSAAIANLGQFDVVGRLDRLEDFRSQIKRELGVRVRVGHENKARRHGETKWTVFTPELRQKVVELCAPDIEVWNATVDKGR